jgi:hypothetical protein
MCYAVYLASERELPTSAWKVGESTFYVREIDAEVDGRVHAEQIEPLLRRHVTKPYLYYAGAHTGCGCGFFYDLRWDPQGEERAEQEKNRASAQALVEYLEGQLEVYGQIEMVVLWEGSQESAKAITRKRITPRQLLGPDQFLAEENDVFTIDR